MYLGEDGSSKGAVVLLDLLLDFLHLVGELLDCLFEGLDHLALGEV